MPHYLLSNQRSAVSSRSQAITPAGLIRRLLPLAVLLLMVAAASLSGARGTGVIEGAVSDAGTGYPLAGVEIKAINRGISVLSSDDGTFRLENLAAGRYKLLASASFRARQVREITIAPGQSGRVDFSLGEKVIEMQGLVVTATMTEKDVEAVPATVEVLTRTELDDIGAESIHAALGESQGLNVQFGNGRTVAAGLRGLNANQSLILVDGRRQSLGFNDMLHLDDFPLGMVDRVEIVRGPGSALYGSDAMGGVINLITRRPTDGIRGGFDMRYGQNRYGEAETPFFCGNLSGSNGKVGFALSTTLNSRDYYDRDKTDFLSDGDNYDVAAGSGMLRWEAAPGHSVSGGMDYSRTSQDGDRVMSSGDGKKETEWDRRSVFASYEGRLADNLDLMLRVNSSHYENDNQNYLVGSGQGVTPMTPTGEPYHLEQDMHQFESRISSLLLGRQLITAGVEHRIEDRKDNEVDSDVNNSALFFQDEFWFSDVLLAVAGARFDHHSEFGSEFSPRLGVTLCPESNFRIKVSYGEGFRAPTIYELHVRKDTPRNLVVPNSNLDAETSSGFEIGAEGEAGPFSARATYFRNDIDQMINTVQIGVDTVSQTSGGGSSGSGSGGGGGGGGGGQAANTRPIFMYENVDEALVQGLELRLALELPGGFSVAEEALILDAEDSNTGLELFNRPDFVNTVKLAYIHERLGLKANFRIISTGEQHLSLNDKADGYTVCNVHLSKSLASGFRLYGGIDNLFNADPYFPKFDGTGTYFYTGIALDYR